MRRNLRALVWLALLAAGIVASIAWIVPLRDPGEHEQSGGHEARLEALYPVPLDALSAVEIVTGGRLYRFERDAAGAWFFHAHAHAPGDAGHTHAADPAAAQRIGEALAMSARTRIERRLPFDPSKRATYGLAYPPLILILYAAGQNRPVLTVETGDLAPDTISRYALLPDRGMLVTIPDYQVANLHALVSSIASGS
jgi:hypothetical protein